MALEQQIKGAIEAITAQLSGQLQERLQGLAAELSETASAEHARALEGAVAETTAELASRHESAMAALRAEASEQRELAVSMARTEAAEEREAALAALHTEVHGRQQLAIEALRADLAVEHAAALDAVRAQLVSGREADLEALRAELVAERETAVAAALEQARGEAELQKEHALADLGAELATQHQGAIDALRAEADGLLAHAREDADARLEAARTEAESELARTIEAAKADAAEASSRALVDARATERQAELALADRLADAIRRLDGARSLIEVLDLLVDASAREAPRVAVFLVRGNTLAGWRAAGFTRADDPRELEVPLDHAGLLGRAVSSPAAAVTSDAASADGDATPFGSLPLTSAAVAIPLRVGGETVGVLYADDVSPREHQVPGSWPESLEVLTRHACRCLEVVTIARVTQPVAIPPRSSSTPTPRRLTPQARAFQPGHDDDDDAARRYARLLVSEIKLYHESAVTAGRRDRNLLERLRAEIERARRLYDERVPPSVLTRTDYFNQELVRTLANGDAALLGPA